MTPDRVALATDPGVSTKVFNESALPENVLADPEIADRIARGEVYESDALDALDRESGANARKADTMEKKLQALIKFIRAVQERQELLAEIQKKKATAMRLKAEQGRRGEFIEGGGKAGAIEAEIADLEGRLTALEGSEEFAMLGRLGPLLPLKVATQFENYPTASMDALRVPVRDEAGNIVPGEFREVEMVGPMYVPSGRMEQFVGGTEKRVAREGTLGWARLTSEEYRTGERHTIFNILQVAARLGEDISRMENNEQFRFIVASLGDKAEGILGADTVRGLWDEAVLYADSIRSDVVLFAQADEAYRINNLDDTTTMVTDDGAAAYSPGLRNPTAARQLVIRQKYGELLTQEMALRGYTPVDIYGKLEKGIAVSRITEPEAIIEEARLAREEAALEAGRPVPPIKVTPATMFIPTGIKEVMLKRFESPNDSLFGQSMDWINKQTGYWKVATLAFSIMWQIGDLISNIIIVAATNTPQDFIQYLRNMKTVIDEEYGGFTREGLKRMLLAEDNVVLPAGPGALPPTAITSVLRGSGVQDLSASMQERLAIMGVKRKDPKQRKFATNVLVDLTRSSFKLNESINRFSRHALVLLELQKALEARGKGLSDLPGDASWARDPELRQMVFESADTANKWLGDFANLSIAERRYMTGIVPFYAWTKHIHQVFYAIGLDHPHAIRWTTYMGSIFYDPEDDPMGLRQGAFSIFGGVANYGFLNPIGDVAAGPLISFAAKGDIRPALSQLGPAVRLPAGLLFGLDVSNMQRLTRPTGTGLYSELGQSRATPLIFPGGGRGLKEVFTEAVGYTASQVPIAQRLLNVLPGTNVPFTNIALGPVARYQTSEARLSPTTGERIYQPGGRPAALGRFFSLPFIPYRSDDTIADMQLAAVARLRTLEALRRRQEAEDD